MLDLKQEKNVKTFTNSYYSTMLTVVGKQLFHRLRPQQQSVSADWRESCCCSWWWWWWRRRLLAGLDVRCWCWCYNWAAFFRRRIRVASQEQEPLFHITSACDTPLSISPTDAKTFQEK